MFCRRMDLADIADRADLADLRDPVASVSVDLDPLWCYYAIHGLPGGDALPEGLRDVVLRRALPRFVGLFHRHGVRATLFVVGKDGEAEPGRRGLVEAARAGHELGNHSYSHPYDLSMRGAAEANLAWQTRKDPGAPPSPGAIGPAARVLRGAGAETDPQAQGSPSAPESAPRSPEGARRRRP